MLSVENTKTKTNRKSLKIVIFCATLCLQEKCDSTLFLYRLTGCRELDLEAGQQTHMLSHAEKIFLEINPIFLQFFLRQTKT